MRLVLIVGRELKLYEGRRWVATFESDATPTKEDVEEVLAYVDLNPA